MRKERRWRQKFLLGLEYAKHCSPLFPVQSAKILLALARGDGARCSSLVLHMYGPALLADTLAACRALHMKPFLAWGTLLGYYREGGLIAHDYDIDLGILEDNFSRKEELVQAMKQRGYAVRANNDYFISFFRHRCKRPWIDLQLFYWKNDQVACSIPSSHQEDLYTYYFPANIFAEFMAVKFLGRLEVLVPMQTEKFLTVAYGNWRIPQKNWHFIYGPLNLVQEKKGK
jgi:hypothetical protein